MIAGAADFQKAFSSISRAAKATERSAKQSTRAVEQEAKKQAKAHEGAAKAAERASKKAADAIVKDEARKTKAAEKESAKRLKAFEREQAKYQHRRGESSSAAFGLVGGAALAAGGTALAIGGQVVGAYGRFIEAGARESFRDDDKARRIAINSGRRGSKDDIRAHANRVAEQNKGTTSDEALTALQSYIDKTGDLDAGMNALDTMIKASSASGASIEDIAGLAGDARNNLKISDPKELQKYLADQIAQGRAGSFELKDMSATAAPVLAAAAAFDPTQMRGYAGGAKVGGLLQIARSATGSGEEAATATQTVFSQLAANADVLKKEGKVRVREKALPGQRAGSGKVRDINDILVDSIAMHGSNFTKKNDILNKVYDKRGMRALNPLLSTFEDTYRKEKGQGHNEKDSLAAASKAVREQLEKSQASVGDWNESLKDAAAAQNTAANELTGAWEKLKNSIGNALIGSVEGYASKLGEMADSLGPPVEQSIEMLIAAFDMLADTATILGDAFDSIAETMGWQSQRVDKRPIREEIRTKSDRIRELNDEIKAGKKSQLPPEMIEEMKADLTKVQAEKKDAERRLKGAGRANIEAGKAGLGQGIAEVGSSLAPLLPGYLQPIAGAISGATSNALDEQQTAIVANYDKVGGSTAGATKALDAFAAKLLAFNPESTRQPTHDGAPN